MSEHFAVEHDGAQARITLGGVLPGNALTLPALRELAGAIRAAGERSQTNVLRLRGLSGDFSVGRAPEVPGPDAATTAHEIRSRLLDPILDVYAELRALPFPAVAEVSGRATGLGCALVAACDLAIAARGARFSLPEMAKDLPPTLALSALARKVNAKTVASLVYGLAEIDAPTALAAGLIGEVVSDELLAARADEICHRIGRRNPIALAALKRYLQSMYDADAVLMAELAASVLSGAVSSIRGGNTSR